MLVLFEQVCIVLLIIRSQRRQTVLVSVLTGQLPMSGTMWMVGMLLVLLISHGYLVAEDALGRILHIDLLRLAERESASCSYCTLAVEDVVA